MPLGLGAVDFGDRLAGQRRVVLHRGERVENGGQLFVDDVDQVERFFRSRDVRREYGGHRLAVEEDLIGRKQVIRPI